ncbi:MAG: polyphenol oxidase family protein [Acidimicrobiales bacterium]
MQTRGGVGVVVWPALEALGVDAVVTTRHGGVSSGAYESLNLALGVGDDPAAVAENRRRAAGTLGASLVDLVVGAQVHGREATVVGSDDRGRGATDLADAVPGADALVTRTCGPVLVTLVADCAPIVLVDPEARVLATVHAGWRGTAGRVVDAAIRAMVDLGGRPDRVVAGIGPAVSKETYQVGADVAESVRSGVGDDRAVLPTGDGRWLVDLPGANRRLLEAAGVPPSSVFVMGLTTGAQGSFFSHRARRPCGRFGLLARLRP